MPTEGKLTLPVKKSLLLFPADLNKHINDDQQRIERQACDDPALKKSCRAQQQADDQQNQGHHGQRAGHDAGLMGRGIAIFLTVVIGRTIPSFTFC